MLDSYTRRLAKQLGTDLVEATYILGCCSECAKYRGRWFSISGKTTVFPKVPQKYKCSCQGIVFYPVILDVSKPTYCPQNTDIISFSNRPFIDDRTLEERKTYEMYARDKEVETKFAPYRLRFEEIKDRDKQQYNWICKKMPDKAPKSFAAYRRMKRGKSKNYLDLVSFAQELGFNLNYSQEEQQMISEIELQRKEYASSKAEYNNYFNQFKEKTRLIDPNQPTDALINASSFWLDEAKELVATVNTTCNVHVFYSRYNELIDIYDSLSQLEKEIVFPSEQPSSVVKRLKDNKNYFTLVFIKRSLAGFLQELKKYPRKQKEKAIEDYFSQFNMYSHVFSEENLSYLRSERLRLLNSISNNF